MIQEQEVSRPSGGAFKTPAVFSLIPLKDGGLLRWSSIYIRSCIQILLPESLVFKRCEFVPPQCLSRNIQFLHLDQANLLLSMRRFLCKQTMNRSRSAGIFESSGTALLWTSPFCGNCMSEVILKDTSKPWGTLAC